VVGRRPKFTFGCGVTYYYNLVGTLATPSKLLVGGQQYGRLSQHTWAPKEH
jgi:hypothetical protein